MALVNKSAIIKCVDVYCISTSFCTKFSLTKLYLVSMCFDLLWYLASFAKDIAAWLSQYIIIGLEELIIILRTLINLLSHTTYCTVIEHASYSASIVDRAMHVCFLLLQEIAPWLSKNAYMKVDFRSPRLPPQSASV